MFRQKINDYIQRVKALNGDPHYVAMGMGIGVFIAGTPTIPFHTVLAIALAVLLKASKPAAILGTWVSNPFTVVFLYAACYQTGHLFFENTSDAMALIRQLIEHLESQIPFSEKMDYFQTFVQAHWKTFFIMNVGGIILGFPAGVAAYIITHRAFFRLRQKKLKNKGQI
jgi:uncharacterized protein (DUF2062 family)